MSEELWEQGPAYRAAFRELHGFSPYDYQVALAAKLIGGRNVVLRAPTGSGKTKAVLTPFLVDGIDWPSRPYRLIYALPLRTLVQQIHAEVKALLGSASLRRRGFQPSDATIQTGEQPDDEFFDRGRIIVTTYDQVLSGLLCAPYGLSRRRRNINAAAAAGALVVFDEFHLMGLTTAFLTGAAGLRLFGGLTQCVWMTATATRAPVEAIIDALDADELALGDAEVQALPIIATTTREVRWEGEPLTSEAVKAMADGRVIVIVNQVGRAQKLFSDLSAWAEQQGVPLQCLHSGFFKNDRDERVRKLQTLFGKQSTGRAILIATQAIEAGVDISCEHLLTEICPMNALLQRAGRCARFENEHGTVHVYALPTTDHAWLPYGDRHAPLETIKVSEAILSSENPCAVSPERARIWVERVHGESDARAIDQIGWRERLDTILGLIHASVVQGAPGNVADLIRETDESRVRAIIATEDALPAAPSEREALSVSRSAILRVVGDDGSEQTDSPHAWYWNLSLDDPVWQPLETRADAQRAYIVCLSPAVARYTPEVGLQIGATGERVSPLRGLPPRPGYGGLKREAWVSHTRGVTRAAIERWARESGAGLIARGIAERHGISRPTMDRIVRACGLLHDIGKLQQPWQDWATRYQRARDPSWSPVEPLAHTDFDPRSETDRQLEQGIRPRRGPHAVASAWYGLGVLAPLLADVPPALIPPVASACAAAVVSHHGGWIPGGGPLTDVKPMIVGWDAWVGRAAQLAPPFGPIGAPRGARDQQALKTLLDQTTAPGALEDWFALVAYLMRTLRLSDHQATAEGGD